MLDGTSFPPPAPIIAVSFLFNSLEPFSNTTVVLCAPDKTYYPIVFNLFILVDVITHFLSTDSYFNFLSGLMITLFVAALVMIFVYEYEVLRRSKT